MCGIYPGHRARRARRASRCCTRQPTCWRPRVRRWEDRHAAATRWQPPHRIRNVDHVCCAAMGCSRVKKIEKSDFFYVLVRRPRVAVPERRAFDSPAAQLIYPRNRVVQSDGQRRDFGKVQSTRNAEPDNVRLTPCAKRRRVLTADRVATRLEPQGTSSCFHLRLLRR